MLYKFNARIKDGYEGTISQYEVKMSISGEVDAANRKDAIKVVKDILTSDGFEAAAEIVNVRKA